MTKLSEHFTLEELTASQYATRHNIDNTPSPSVLGNLYVLANTLEAVRKLFNKPLVISSGYRCPMLNKAVGGAENSAHKLGLAADFTIPSLQLKDIVKAIVESDIQFHQIIYEGNWIHLGLCTDKPQRREVLTATFTNGVASYSKGLK